MSAPRRYAVSCELPFSREAVWQVLAHTDRLNRQIGLSAVTYGAPARDEFGLYRPASSKILGVVSRWREYPFEWEQHKSYAVVRRYASGPFERFEGGVELEALEPNRTRVTVWSEIEARGVWGAVITPALAQKFLARTLRYYGKTFTADAAPRASAPPPARGGCNEEALSRLVGELSHTPVREDYARALGEFLRDAGDDEVASLRPFEWAEQGGLERDEALRTCLYAVRIGLLNLRWAMMCPNCRVAKNEAQSLAEVQNSVHCDLCGVDYDLNFDRYVELKFAVHPAIRAASSDIFCLSGPARAPHILEQFTLEAGAHHGFTVPAGVPVRLRVLGDNHATDIETDDATRPFALSAGGWSRDDETGEPSDLVAPPLAPEAQTHEAVPIPICVDNRSGAAATVVLEKREWDNQAVTAARVTALQEFRDLFGSEVLAPGRQVAVESVTLFFSDLSNSTALYERIGDAPAFGRVGGHFEFLTRFITHGNGALVKTMGDAVMAVFHRPEDAVATAIAIQREFRDANQGGADGLSLKIGLHCGPALAVNSNGRLDYFGRTVNIAARAAGISHGGDVILTGETWKAANVAGAARQAGARPMRFRATLRGVEASRELVRLQLGD